MPGFSDQNNAKGPANPVDFIDWARRTAQPQFICGARAAAPGTGVLSEKVVFDFFSID
jgi:hypothetical protein